MDSNSRPSYSTALMWSAMQFPLSVNKKVDFGCSTCHCLTPEYRTNQKTMARRKRQTAQKTRTHAAAPAALPWWLALGIITTIYAILRINAVDIPLDRDEGGFGHA